MLNLLRDSRRSAIVPIPSLAAVIGLSLSGIASVPVLADESASEGLTGIRDATVSELNDVASALRGLDQSYYYRGFSSVSNGRIKAFTAGSAFMEGNRVRATPGAVDQPEPTAVLTPAPAVEQLPAIEQPAVTPPSDCPCNQPAPAVQAPVIAPSAVAPLPQVESIGPADPTVVLPRPNLGHTLMPGVQLPGVQLPSVQSGGGYDSQPWVTEHVSGTFTGGRRPPQVAPAGPGSCGCSGYMEATGYARPYVSGSSTFYRSPSGSGYRIW